MSIPEEVEAHLRAQWEAGWITLAEFDQRVSLLRAVAAELAGDEEE